MATTTSKPTQSNRVTILDVPIDCIDMGEALDRIDAFIQQGIPHHVVTADASMLVIAHEDSELKSIIRRAELVTPDGAGLLWAAQRQNTPFKERVSGVVLVEKLCALSPQKGYRIFFFGAAPGVSAQACEQMRNRYPGAQMVGSRDGFFTPDQIPALIAEIREAQPDILCVALGIPKQEKFIATYRQELGVPVLIGVGGTFDVLSGNLRRAPVWMQKLNLEWLWRLLQNPSKISKVKLLPRFVGLVRRSPRSSA